MLESMFFANKEKTLLVEERKALVGYSPKIKETGKKRQEKEILLPDPTGYRSVFTVYII